MKNILIAGGAGFIGSHLCERLIADNKIICVDNLVTGSLDNLRDFMSNPNFEYVNVDVSSTDFLKVLKSRNIDRIYNMASPASPVDYMKYPIETLRVGSAGAENLLELSRLSGARILMASTSEIYGDPMEHPQSEDYWGNVNPVGPRSCYDEAKRFMEALAVAYAKIHLVQVRIARIFNTYGPRMRLNDGRVVPNFISQALKGEAFTIYGDGSQTRSFCYVEDMVEGLIALMESSLTTPVNLGNPTENTVMEFAKLVAGLLHIKPSYDYKPMMEDDPRKRRPDVSKAREHLAWQAKFTLSEGLAKTIEYFRAGINEHK